MSTTSRFVIGCMLLLLSRPAGALRVCDAPPPGVQAGSEAPSIAPTAVTAPPNEGTLLRLLGGRFQATVRWRAYDGTTGDGAAVSLSDEAGYFYFFDPANVEILVKMVDACGHPDFENFWVFAAGLTDIEVELTVADILGGSGEVVTHATELGQPFPPLLETGRFRFCGE